MRRRRRGRYCSIFSRVSGQQGLRPASPSSFRPPFLSPFLEETRVRRSGTDASEKSKGREGRFFLLRGVFLKSQALSLTLSSQSHYFLFSDSDSSTSRGNFA